jgi:Uncharacterized protein conserved in bacteria
MDILNESEIKKHINFINKKFSITCHNIFTKDEEDILIQYGEWMSALENEILKPITIAQKHFVDVCKNNTQPETKYEKIWIKYKRRMQWEDKYGDTSDRPPVILQRHWQGLTVPDNDHFTNTYQI